MGRAVAKLALAALTLAAALGAAAGCGGGGGEGGGGGGGSPPSGGEVRVLVSSLPDRLDPQLSSPATPRAELWLAHLPLLTYRRTEGEDGSRLIPALAEELPAVSPDGRTYRLRLREGMRYSDGSPIKASDFERGLRRLLDLGGPAAPLFRGIVGTGDYSAGRADSIAGVQADDRSGRITIHLTEPRGDFPNLLALPAAAPVPAGAASAAGGGRPPPASGPYRIAAPGAGRRVELSRNPLFGTLLDAGLELPPGDPDLIVLEREPDLTAQLRAVAEDRADLMAEPVPPALEAGLEAGYPGRLLGDLGLGVRYFWMNTRTLPFNDLRVRQAVNYALDRQRLAGILGERLEPGQQILPRGLPGREGVNLYPGPDLETARKLLAAANPIDASVTVWSDDEPRSRRASAYYRRVLESLGLEARLEVVPADRYRRTVGERATRDLDTGVGFERPRWPHPNELFGRLLSGEAITAFGNRNLAQVEIPELDAEIERLAALGLEQVDGDYGRLDRRFMEQAVWAPWGQERVVSFVSGRIDRDRFRFHPVFGHDYSSLSLVDKEAE